MATPLIEFIDIHKCFGSNAVLSGVNLSIYQGEITAVIGRSGTGKSVLLKHIIGLLHQDAGQLLYKGQPLDRLGRKAKHNFHRDISYMFQDNALFDFLSVSENIALPLTEKKQFPRREIQDRVEEKMSVLGLEETGHKYPSQLSGGMRKRVALARALITEPKAVLFDEPTTGLDPVRRNNIHRMIADYQEQFGFTAVIVSHDIPEIFHITQHVAMLDQGKIIFEGSTEEILGSHSEIVNAFINGKEPPAL
ncbi:MAG: ATP-binding cassette domain-containing protein [Desulfobacterales bacterium]|nr:ATP-binding cassette domain-containing protein [Desulfobacterales bacterium]